ncbi:MAG: PGF-pre-PGF domain-containing protein, partial [Euryarchaeota archaeon]|nr:PGF-pre-PGF domain-containing protein [Euryarchaeota archaeon]
NNGWEVLPTSLIGEDADYVYYTGVTPGFSYFAIVGRPGTGFVEKPLDATFEGPESTITATLPLGLQPEQNVPLKETTEGVIPRTTSPQTTHPEGGSGPSKIFVGIILVVLAGIALFLLKGKN